MKELIKEYKQSLDWIKKALESADDEDQMYLKQMKSNLEFSIEWMKVGHAPGVVRGIERRAVYEREKAFDPLLMQKYFRTVENDYSWTEKNGEESLVTPFDIERIDDALSVLSAKEKEMYLMAKGNCLTQYQIAEYCGISRNTVKTTIERANKKIAAHISISLFSFVG
ncbi:sigma factor-like helix-turn-helix DNA-binding protein [Salipaludibacillus sp. CF4.18]|uniref:sigma factor-like helix-turn-helix DNA-binding protein n=1 Tax=Salipaludibacillus sp. CF4.18 TaxID=3373081 RepID=UPI003EE45BAC